MALMSLRESSFSTSQAIGSYSQPPWSIRHDAGPKRSLVVDFYSSILISTSFPRGKGSRSDGKEVTDAEDSCCGRRRGYP